MNKKRTKHEKYLFLLSGENLRLAEQEALTVFKIKKNKQKDRQKNTVIVELNKEPAKDANRLAYTRVIYKLLFTAKNDDVLKETEKYNWGKEYKENFCVRIHNSGKQSAVENKFSEKELAGIIWRRLEAEGIKPKVNLEKPKTPINFLIDDKKAYCCILIWENTEKFEQRKAQFRPGFSPISLHPKLARAMVNLTGAEPKETIVDPFCGTGGIPIEAVLAGFKARGRDIRKELLDKCRQNLEFYGINQAQCKLKQADAAKLKEKIKYLATDLPYGRSSGQKNKKELEELYLGFLKMLKNNLVKDGNAVAAFPDDVAYKKIIKKAKMKIKKEFSYYVHKSMTKKIVVMGK